MTQYDWKRYVPVALRLLEEKLKTLPAGLTKFHEAEDRDNVHRIACDRDVLQGTWSDADILFCYTLADIDPNVTSEDEDEQAKIDRLIELLEGKP